MTGGAREVRSVERAPWIVVLVIVVSTSLAVLVVPWLVPVPVRAVVSESQAAGFNNRFALMGMAAGGLLLSAASFLFARSRGASPFVRDTPSLESRVDRRLVAFIAAVSALVVVLFAGLYRGRPFGDAAYFIDRMTYIAAGGTLYSEIEFPYGPLLLYPAVFLGRGLELLGVPAFWGYYLFLAALQVLGVALLARLLGHLELPRATRNILFVVVAAFASSQVTLGANLSLVRFLVPFGVSLWALAEVRRARSALWRVAVPVVAVAAAIGVSPEMGVATLVAMVAGLGRSALGGARRLPELLLLLVVAASLAWWLMATPGMFSAFMGGSYQLPLLPGPFVVAYVLASMVTFWGSGAGAAVGDEASAPATAAWAAASLVLAAPALGRADVLHVFNNGLGVFLGAAAVLSLRRPRTARAAAVVVGGVFLVGSLVFQVSAQGPGALASAVRAGSVSEARATRLGRLLGDPGWEWRYADASVADDSALLREVSGAGRVAMLMPLDPLLGAELGRRDQLGSSYTWTQFATSEALLDGILREAGRADVLVVPKADYDGYRAAAAAGEAADPPMWTPRVVGGELRYWQLMLLPVTLPTRNPILDAGTVIGRGLERDWAEAGAVEGYVLLRRR